MCLCKDCDYCEITTYGDLDKYEAVHLCLCCGGQQFIHRPDPNPPKCPYYKGAV